MADLQSRHLVEPKNLNKLMENESFGKVIKLIPTEKQGIKLDICEKENMVAEPYLEFIRFKQGKTL
jgi:hypothetical protein